VRDLGRWKLGAATFVGSSGKVFPHEMKAAPLLRAWLQRLRRAGVRFTCAIAGCPSPGCCRPMGLGTALRHALGRAGGAGRALLLALGGASWSRLGRWTLGARPGGRWRPVAPLQPANCGFDVGWSALQASHHAGAPLKNVVLRCPGPAGQRLRAQGRVWV
jgi:predicted flavoprotein YhiN